MSGEAFGVGDYVIADERREMRDELTLGLFDRTPRRVEVVDRSFCNEPYQVVAMELPYLVLEPAKVTPWSRRYTVDVRMWKFHKLSDGFVASLQGVPAMLAEREGK